MRLFQLDTEKHRVCALSLTSPPASPYLLQESSTLGLYHISDRCQMDRGDGLPSERTQGLDLDPTHEPVVA